MIRTRQAGLVRPFVGQVDAALGLLNALTDRVAAGWLDLVEQSAGVAVHDWAETSCRSQVITERQHDANSVGHPGGVCVVGDRERVVDAVTITRSSTLDAGASLTQTLRARYAGQPGGTAGAFTLNGRRCDTTVILGAAAVPQTTASTAAVSPVAGVSPRD